MKNLFSRITFIFLLLMFAATQAEVYSWVDKDGKKHFGEKVPKEYANQSKTVDVKSVNTMEPVKVQPHEEDIKNSYPARQNFAAPSTNDNDSNLTSCERQKQAYEDSVRCFSRCQSNGNYVNNVSACKNCPDAKKPDC